MPHSNPLPEGRVVGLMKLSADHIGLVMDTETFAVVLAAVDMFTENEDYPEGARAETRAILAAVQEILK